MEELDEVTLHRAKKGDRKAQADFVERYERPVYALVGRMMVAHQSQVEDLAQETFVKALTALPRFDLKGRAQVSTWLLTIATRTTIDALRAMRPTVALVESMQSEEDVEGQVAAGRLKARVEAAMAQLPHEQRAVLILRAYHDLDYSEIAEALEIEIGTVRSRLSRARAALRRVIPKEGSAA